jgi:hypothetical protein
MKSQVPTQLPGVNSPPELEARLAELPVPVRCPGVALRQVSSVRSNLVRNHTLQISTVYSMLNIPAAARYCQHLEQASSMRGNLYAITPCSQISK